MRLRNTSPAFDGELEITETDASQLQVTWRNDGCAATLKADLRNLSFSVSHKDGDGEESLLSYG
jgi:sucrose phosphorylase